MGCAADRPIGGLVDGGHPTDGAVRVRPRRPQDLPLLLPALQRRHEEQGYPVRPEAVSPWWLADPSELGSWVAVDGVAVDGDRVVGHVALHPAGGAPLPLWEQATGRGASGLAVVTRLFTDGSAPGSGRLLLERACAEAGSRGRVPVLQVDPDSGARAFYGRLGWREVGTARQQWGHRTVEAVACVPA